MAIRKPTAARGVVQQPKRRTRPASSDVPRFVGLEQTEIREAYRQKYERVASLAEFAYRKMMLEEIGSDTWTKWAQRLDEAEDAIRPHGRVRLARMMLLDAVDDAVSHAERAARVEHLLPAWERYKQATTLDDVTPDDRAAMRTLATQCSTWTAAEEIRACNGGQLPPLPVFAAQLFSRRCLEFAGPLKEPKNMRLLTALTVAWSRRPGQRLRDGEMPKWDAADELMKALGLVGLSTESLEAEYREHRGNHSRSKAKS